MPDKFQNAKKGKNTAAPKAQKSQSNSMSQANTEFGSEMMDSSKNYKAQQSNKKNKTN